MNLSPAQLAFLHHEMQQIMEDDDRPMEDRQAASTIAGQADGHLEWEQEQHAWLEREKIPHPTESLVE
jgi:hypothetical protein